jgi:hypothetical protein
MGTNSARLILVLRLSGFAMALAVFAVVMPDSCMVATHRLLGLGEFPEAPVADYLARSLSAFYAMYGGLLWVVSTDIRRYAPVIRYLAVVGVVFGVLLYWIDTHAGLPLYWCIVEGTIVTALSLLILVLQRAVESDERRTMNDE